MSWVTNSQDTRLTLTWFAARVVGQFESDPISSGRFAGRQMVSTTRPAKA
jgi:hypothetical protein